MGRILLIIGIVLVVLWALGFFAFSSFYISTPIIHALVVIGVILIIVDLLRDRRI